MDNAGRALRALRRDTCGAVAIITVLVMPVVVGFAGLAVDATYWYMVRLQLQTAVDAAAIGGAFELSNGNDTGVTSTAENDAARNDFDSGIGTITVNVPPTSGPDVGDPWKVEVIISQPVSLFFSALFLSGPMTVQVRAVAGARPGGPQGACILALDPSARAALKLDSNSTIDAQKCAVQVNSDDDEALTINSSTRFEFPGGPIIPAVQAAGVCVTGDFDDLGGGISPTPFTGAIDCPPLADPLAGRSPPPVGSCDYTDTKIVNGNMITGTFSGGTAPSAAATMTPHPITAQCGPVELVTLSPGVYCNGIILDACANVEYLPGEYIIKDGQLAMLSNSVANGTGGVGFYLTGANPSSNSATVFFDSNTRLDIVAPSSGSLEGLVFFEDRNARLGQRHELDSNGIIRFEGILYFSRGEIHIDSNSLSKTPSPYTTIIGRTITMDSNSSLVLRNRICGEVPPPCSDVPVPPGLTVGTGQILKLTE